MGDKIQKLWDEIKQPKNNQLLEDKKDDFFQQLDDKIKRSKKGFSQMVDDKINRLKGELIERWIMNFTGWGIK